MCKGETIEIYHERRANTRVLGNGVSHQRQVERLLVVQRVRLDPTMVKKRQRIALVAVDVPRKRCGAVRVHHDDGEPAARGIRQDLGHVQKALAGRRCERARTRGGRAHGTRKSRVLGLDVHVLGVKRTVGNHLGQSLDNDGLGRDGIRRNHLWPGKANTLGEGFVTRKKTLHQNYTSGSMQMASNLHARTHMPHPLQKS